MPKKKTTSRSRATRPAAAKTAPARSAATATTTQRSLSFLQLIVMFVVLFVVNSIVVYIANLLFPSNVVLGNHMIDMWSALFMSMLVLTVINVGAIPVIEMVGHGMRWTPSNRDWMVLFFFINAVALWILGRMAEMIGIGFSSWFVVVLLAAVLDVIQGLVVVKVVTPLSNRGA